MQEMIAAEAMALVRDGATLVRRPDGLWAETYELRYSKRDDEYWLRIEGAEATI